LDVYANRVFKDYLKQSMDDQLFKLALEYAKEKPLKILGGPDMPEPDAGYRRVLLTKYLGEAWQKFCEEKRQDWC
jgi:hypothetical protein